MRIAIVSQVLDRVADGDGNSVGLITRHLARALAAKHEVMVFATDDGAPAGGAGDDGVRWRATAPSWRDELVARAWGPAGRLVGSLRQGRRPQRSTSALLGRAYITTVAQALRSAPVDLVHVQHATQYLPVLRRALPDAALVLHLHARWFPQTPRHVLADRLRHADAVVAVSDHVRDAAVSWVPEIADRCVTVPNGVDVARFAGAAVGAGTGSGSAARIGQAGVRARRLLYVGALSPHKGVHDAVAAFAMLAGRHHDLELRVVGPPGTYPLEENFDVTDRRHLPTVAQLYRGDYVQHLRELAGPQFSARLRLLGGLPPESDALVREIHGADVFVFPPVWDEAFGLPALEAMAAGCPVVVTRVGGLPEVVSDGRTGLVVEPGNPAGLADALERLLADGALRRRLGASGRERARLAHDWPVVTARFETVYDRVLGGAVVAHPGLSA